MEWYEAHLSFKREIVQGLIDDKATFSVPDARIKTKQHYLEHFSDWTPVRTDGTNLKLLGYEVDREPEYRMRVCYSFPENDTYARDTFVFRHGKLVEFKSRIIGDNCDEAEAVRGPPHPMIGR